MKKRILLVSLIVAVGLLSSCTKNDKTTITPIGTENIDDLDDILSVLSDTVAFWDGFGDVYEGAIPPDVQGNYKISPMKRIGTNVPDVPAEIVESDVFLHLSKQNNGTATANLYFESETETDTVFVMGLDNYFTVYFIEKKAFDVSNNQNVNHVRLERGIIMTGSVTPSGIANFRMATVIREMEDDADGTLSYPQGSFFIYKDDDGISERI